MAARVITLREAVDEYLSLLSAGGRAPKTVKAYTGVLDLMVRYVGSGKNVRNITAKDMEEFFVTGKLARTKMVSPATVNRDLTIVSGFLKFCESRAWNNHLILRNIKRFPKQEKHRLRLSAHELWTVLEFQKHPRDRMIIALGMNTALRASEIASLRVGDVDLGNGWLYITMHKNRKVDTFPINADLDAELRRWLTWYTEQVGELRDDYRLVPAREKGGVLAKREDGRVLWTSGLNMKVVPERSCYNYIQRKVQSALLELGYPTKYEGLHTLRRSVARLYFDKMVAEGHPKALQLTQHLLNHSSVIITENYIGATQEREDRNKSLRGKPFLSSLITSDNVVPIKKAEGE